MTIEEGAQVAYVGHHLMLEVGDEGVALDVGNTGTHVRWTTGARKGQVDLVSNGDLVANASNDGDLIVRAHRMRQADLADGWWAPAPGEIEDDSVGWI